MYTQELLNLSVLVDGIIYTDDSVFWLSKIGTTTLGGPEFNGQFVYRRTPPGTWKWMSDSRQSLTGQVQTILSISTAGCLRGRISSFSTSATIDANKL